MPLSLLFIAALSVIMTLTAAADAQRDRGDGVTLYEHPNYQGRSIVLDTDAPSLRYVNFNDITSSIQVSGGQWEVCIDSEYRGVCQVIDKDQPDMSQWAFNDQISSLRPVHNENRRGRIRKNGVTLWSDPHFTGRSVTLIDAEDNLRLQNFNDAAQSIEVHSGVWTVCEDSDFTGRCVRISRNARNLNVYDLNRKITSVIPGRRGARFRPRHHDVHANPGYGGGRSHIRGGVYGVETLFFPAPEVQGYPVSGGCLGDHAGCGQDTADEICALNGFRRAEFFSTHRTRERLWFIFEHTAHQGRSRITDVLCVR